VPDFATALVDANGALAALHIANPGETRLYSVQFVGTDAYLFIDSNADGVADMVVVLNNVDATEIDSADIGP
jgi:hypothetical protein